MILIWIQTSATVLSFGARVTVSMAHGVAIFVFLFGLAIVVAFTSSAFVVGPVFSGRFSAHGCASVAVVTSAAVIVTLSTAACSVGNLDL